MFCFGLRSVSNVTNRSAREVLLYVSDVIEKETALKTNLFEAFIVYFTFPCCLGGTIENLKNPVRGLSSD